MANTNSNKTLNVPNLRFPEFSGEWKKCTLNEVSSFIKEKINTDKLTTENYISTENMKSNFGGVETATSVPESTSVIRYQKGDVLLSNIRPYLRKVWAANRDGGCSTDVFVFRANKLFPPFLYYIMANDSFINYVMSGAKGVKMPRGDKEQMLKHDLSIPIPDEQYQISYFLSLLDSRIATQNKIIDKLQSLIKGLTHKVTEEGMNNGSWRKKPLSDILVERKEFNSRLYPVYSVSVSEGVINQIEYLGRSFAAKDTSNYHVVKHGDIVYTKSPTGDFPYGIVKQSFIQENVAVSPLYGVYTPTSFEIGIFLHYYFMSATLITNYLYPLIQKGAKNTINISNLRFLENSIPFPTDMNKIRTIAQTLIVIKNKLNNEKSKLKLLNQQRNYLLHQLFI